MSAIRPDLPALPARVDTGLRPDARAAQAAFFRAAMGETAAVSAPVQRVAPQAVAPVVTPVRTAPAAEAPAAGRPGSLLDIRV